MRSFSFLSLLLLLFPANHIFAKAEVVPLDKIIVVVNDNIITQLELDERVKLISQQLKQRGSRLPPNDVLHKQILERLILEKIQLELADKSGIRITDEMVNRVVENIARENRLSMAQFRKVLQKDGYQFADFRENIRREIIIARLRKMQVENKITVSEQEINNYLKQFSTGESADDEYHISHILIATPEAATPQQTEDARQKAQQVMADLQQGADFAETAIAVSNDELALKGGDMDWRKTAQLPALFAPVINKMSNNELQGPLRSASGFHIIKLHEKRSKAQKHIINQTLARHILIQPTQVVSREEARLRLEGILQRIKAGEDFASLARANSDDKASAAEGGSLDWVSPGAMVPAFEEEMNKLKPGEISKPFLTEFGWHIVQVLSRRKHDSTKEFQRSQAIQLLRNRKTEEAVQDWLRRLRAEAYVDYLDNK